MLREYKLRLTQVICALLYNCNLTGFARGKLYQGPMKQACVPGLNCYSCPGAVGACPLGSLQSALASAKYRFNYYVVGLLLLFGVVLGRVVCGFLCPFGLVQELLYKLPTKKAPKGNWSRRLSLLKYVILLVFVIALPVILDEPAFCKYLCPQGTLEGGLALTLMQEQLRSLVGFLFTWKVGVLIAVIVSAVFIFRSFCRFLCPLGAFYSLFYKVSICGVKVEEDKCIGCNVCNVCVHRCKLDVQKIGDRECVQCGECIGACPVGAIGYKQAFPAKSTGKDCGEGN